MFLCLRDIPEAGIGKGVFLENVLSQTALRAWELAVPGFSYTNSVCCEDFGDCLFKDSASKRLASEYGAGIVLSVLGAEMLIQFQLDFTDPDVVESQNGSSVKFDLPTVTESGDPNLTMAALRYEYEGFVVRGIVDLWFHTAVKPVRELLQKVVLFNLQTLKPRIQLVLIAALKDMLDDQVVEKIRPRPIAMALPNSLHLDVRVAS